MTEYSYSLDTYFGGFVPNNIRSLIVSVNENSVITKNLLSTQTSDGNFTFTFDNTLSTGEENELTNIVTNHDNTNYPNKIELQKSLTSNESYIATHFYDYSNQRKVHVTEETFETRDDTPYVFNSGVSDHFDIDDVSASLYSNGFRMVESSYSSGSNISPNGTAISSSDSQSPSNGNDNSTGTFWYNSTSVSAIGSWWGVDFGEVVGVVSANFTQYSTSLFATDVAVEWSNDGETWTEIDRVSGATYGSGTFTFPTFSEPVFARYFRFLAYGTSNTTYFIIREGRFFEAVGSGFSTNTPCLITNDPVNKQFKTDDWSQINSCKLNGIFPANTTTKILLSFDERSTWVYWNGSSWTASSLANIGTASMSNTTFDSLTTANYNSANGLNSGTKSLDIAIQIETSNSSVTPVITDILFNITTNTFEELAIDSMVQVRFIGANKTYIKNVTESNKTFNIKIYI